MSKFTFGEIVTIYSGRMCVSGGSFGTIAQILDHIVGYPVWTHQLNIVAERVKPYLLEQFPWLWGIEGAFDGIHGPDAFMAKIEQLSQKYGKEHELLTPMPRDYGAPSDPIDDAHKYWDDDHIFTMGA